MCRSVGPSVCRSVCPVHCGKNGGSDPDAVWHHRSDGSRDEADGAVWGSVHRKGVLWGEFGARHCIQWGLYGVRVPQCVHRRSCGLGGACGGPRHCWVNMGVNVVQGEGEVLGILFSVFTMRNAIGSPTAKCFRFVCKNLTTFLFGKRIVGKLGSWALWRYIQFQDQSWGL